MVLIILISICSKCFAAELEEYRNSILSSAFVIYLSEFFHEPLQTLVNKLTVVTLPHITSPSCSPKSQLFDHLVGARLVHCDLA
ncbi:hypothetical protein C8R48DRAFT_735117 [Suillus tomentosus]|nr:hypothetical protein C8R48DRAFT_735117 [Suillus tomentosus]